MGTRYFYFDTGVDPSTIHCNVLQQQLQENCILNEKTEVHLWQQGGAIWPGRVKVPAQEVKGQRAEVRLISDSKDDVN